MMIPFTLCRDVTAAINAITQDLDNAVRGKHQMPSSLPSSLTPKRTLQLQAKAMKAKLMKLKEIGKDAIENGDMQEVLRKLGGYEAVSAV